MRLAFELDPQIIHHIIHSQAGSIGKAIIELIMNSVDAGASIIHITVDKKGFTCVDNGRGFASREEVVLYFGKFGTPHKEGDATYGRFRLGRGQIMAHAITSWSSNRWQMYVDTQTMGYSYELEEQSDEQVGCCIVGTWYETLTDAEHRGVLQEIRELVRYTPTQIIFNNDCITRDPATETWNYEDENAYYRLRTEGSVGIYNQGILVRHDSGHYWGVGGLIVTKKPIALNVSRTEILRKTCPIWSAISKQFKKLALEFSADLANHRKTEQYRETMARSMLEGGMNEADFWSAEVITLLPGKRHVTLRSFLCRTEINTRSSYTIVDADNVPKGELIAREGLLTVVHEQTLRRFGCYTPQDFHDCLERFLPIFSQYVRGYKVPTLLAFEALSEAYCFRTQLVDDKCLDPDTRAAWSSFKLPAARYALDCLISVGRGPKTRYRSRPLAIVLGNSNVAEAWTDGKTYIGISTDIVKRFKAEPLKTASYIFNLIEHEVAHEGDSIEAGHDEVFFQRFHDIAMAMGAYRQHYVYKWLTSYTRKLERQSNAKPKAKRAINHRDTVEAFDALRQSANLPASAHEVQAHAYLSLPDDITGVASPFNLAAVNAVLASRGLIPSQDAILEAISTASALQKSRCAQERNQAQVDRAEYTERLELAEESERAYFEEIERRDAELLDDEYFITCQEESNSQWLKVFEDYKAECLQEIESGESQEYLSNKSAPSHIPDDRAI